MKIGPGCASGGEPPLLRRRIRRRRYRPVPLEGAAGPWQRQSLQGGLLSRKNEMRSAEDSVCGPDPPLIGRSAQGEGQDAGQRPRNTGRAWAEGGYRHSPLSFGSRSPSAPRHPTEPGPRMASRIARLSSRSTAGLGRAGQDRAAAACPGQGTGSIWGRFAPGLSAASRAAAPAGAGVHLGPAPPAQEKFINDSTRARPTPHGPAQGGARGARTRGRDTGRHQRRA